MTKTIDESWLRHPEAKIRMREGGLKTFLEGLGEDGFCAGATPRITMVEDGIYIEILLNVGKHGSVIALPLEVFIPAQLPVSKKTAKQKKAKEVPPLVEEPLVVETMVVEPILGS